MFQMEQEEYANEGIRWQHIQFQDNDELDPKNFIITDCKTFKNNNSTTNRSSSQAISKI